MEQFINVLKSNPNYAYDFLCENYYTMTKDELKNIAKELLFAIYENTDKAEHDEILNYVAMELEYYYIND